MTCKSDRVRHEHSGDNFSLVKVETAGCVGERPLQYMYLCPHFVELDSDCVVANAVA